jgi:flavin-dependent dehydrogenase
MTQDKIFDVAVVGGGPAGTSAAITAVREGFAVALLESGSFPRHKVCGEFISGEALPILKSLIANDEWLADIPLIENARVFLDGRVVNFKVQPAAASLSRHALDFELWKSAIALGVHARDRIRATAVSRNQSFFSIQSEQEHLKARAVIDASGRWSNLSRTKHATADHWIGLKQHFYEERASLDCDLYFFPGGYCGVQSLGNGTINVAAMVRADVARSLAMVFRQHHDLEERSRQWRPASEAVATSPLIFGKARTSNAGTVLVGDAAAFIDPFVGDGISRALHSGRLGAISLGTYLRGECSLQTALRKYDRSHKELLQPALQAAARLRRMLQLPKALRLTALSLIQFPPLARLAVQHTRVGKVA